MEQHILMNGNWKFLAADKTQAQAVQEHLFSLGAEWISQGRTIMHVPTNMFVLKAGKLEKYHGTPLGFVADTNYEETTISQILSVPAPAKEMTREEVEAVLGYKIKITGGGTAEPLVFRDLTKDDRKVLKLILADFYEDTDNEEATYTRMVKFIMDAAIASSNPGKSLLFRKEA
jgi:hypothetical protein